MAYTVISADEQVFEPPSWGSEDFGRTLIELPLHASLRYSQANLWRYPPGARGRRHREPVQEEVFCVIEGTLTMLLGESPERFELSPRSLVVVEPEPRFSCATSLTQTLSSLPTELPIRRPTTRPRFSPTRSRGFARGDIPEHWPMPPFCPYQLLRRDRASKWSCAGVLSALLDRESPRSISGSVGRVPVAVPDRVLARGHVHKDHPPLAEDHVLPACRGEAE
jgi:mannose-6-phosphate isomerase-like protein (cupin superfamily)